MKRAIGPFGFVQGVFVQLDEERMRGELEMVDEALDGEALGYFKGGSVENDAHGKESGLAS